MSELTTTEARLPQTYAEMEALCVRLARSEYLPEHLRGKWIGSGKTRKFEPFPIATIEANAMLIVDAAVTFRMIPSRLASYSFVVGAKLDFNGLVYKALADSRGGLVEKLSIAYTGTGDDRGCKVSGRLHGEREPRTAEAYYLEAKTTERYGDRKGQTTRQWEDVDQMLAYYCYRRWVRRHIPGVLLGLASDVPDNDYEAEALGIEPAMPAQPKPESQRRIEEQGPSEAYRRLFDEIARCQNNAERKVLASKIKAANLPEDQRQILLDGLRADYAAAEAAEQPQSETLPGIAEDTPEELEERYERDLRLCSDQEQLNAELDVIEGDDRLAAEAKGRLAKIGIGIAKHLPEGAAS